MSTPPQDPGRLALLQQAVVESFLGVVGAPDDNRVATRAEEALAALDEALAELSTRCQPHVSSPVHTARDQ